MRLARFKGIGLQNSWGTFEKVEVEQTQEKSPARIGQAESILRISPEGDQSAAGISDFDSALDSHSGEDQPPDSGLNAAAVSGVTGEIMLPDKAADVEKREGAAQSMRNNRQARKTSATKADSGGRTLKPDIGAEIEVDDEGNADDDEWGADYGQMDEEITKWRKQ